MRRRGFRAERELAAMLNGFDGVAAWRIPASGTTAAYLPGDKSFSLPDVLAIRCEPFTVYGFQVKATEKPRFVLRGKDLVGLQLFASQLERNHIPAECYATVKFVGAGWVIRRVEGFGDDKNRYVFQREEAVRLRQAVLLVLGKQRTVDM